MSMASASNTLAHIREESKLGYSGDIAIVDKLLEAHWCEEQDLLCAYGILQESELDIAIVFFQLPFPIRLPERWIQIQARYGHPYIHFRTTGTLCNIIDRSAKYEVEQRKNFAELETYRNAMLKNDSYGFMVRSQVLMSFQLWGPRIDCYDNYLNALTNERMFASVIVNKEMSWLPDSQPLTAETFEVNLARRLRTEAVLALREFIPVYATTCQDPHARPPEYLDSYFMMVKSGRIVVLGSGNSMMAQFAQPLEFKDYSDNLSVLRNRLKARKTPTIYESYLLEAVRQIEMGAPNLAIVQTIMILDWFANEIIQDRLLRKVANDLTGASKVTRLVIDRLWETPSGRKDWNTRISTMDKFRSYLSAVDIRLPSHLYGQLDEAIELRNKIIHRIQVEDIDEKTANNIVALGMKVIESCMECILSKSSIEE